MNIIAAGESITDAADEENVDRYFNSYFSSPNKQDDKIKTRTAIVTPSVNNSLPGTTTNF